MNEIDRVVAFHLGDSDEIVDVSEYHERYTGPTVGFQPNG